MQDHCTIPLTKGKFAIVDAVDYERVAAHRWYAEERRYTFYARRRLSTECGGGLVYMHRFLLDAEGHQLVDHENGNGLDNRRSVNIRICTHGENVANRAADRDNTSGFKGVTFDAAVGRWMVQFGTADKYLGHYDDIVYAAHVYDHAARIAYGEFARCNFPEQDIEAEPIFPVTRRDNTTGYRGVSLARGGERFRAYIQKDGVRENLGVFVLAQDAARARDARAIELFGSRARLNFPT